MFRSQNRKCSDFGAGIVTVLYHGGAAVRFSWLGNAIRCIRRMILLRFWRFAHRWSTRGSFSGP